MAATESDKHVFVNNFKIDFHDDIVKCSSINMTAPKIATTTGLDQKERTFRPGRPTFGNITFQGAEHKESVKDVRKWVKDAYDGKQVRKNITIEIHDQAHAVVRTFHLMECLPVAYSSIDFTSQGGGMTMHWVLEIRVQRVEMD
jgi:phage tail-like protein